LLRKQQKTLGSYFILPQPVYNPYMTDCRWRKLCPCSRYSRCKIKHLYCII